MPVTVGFTSAAALTIGSGQLTSLFGLPGKPNTFIESWHNFFSTITKFNPWDTALGLLTIALLILAKVSNNFHLNLICYVYNLKI